MAKITTKDDTRDIEWRQGVDPFGNAGWRGMNTEKDPGSLQPNELQLGRDVRLLGGNVVTRTGLALLFDLTQLEGVGSGDHVHWMDEFPNDNPHTRLWFAALGCFGAGAGTGAQIMRVDTLEDPTFQIYANFLSETSFSSRLSPYGDRMMIGNGDLLQEIFQITPPPGVSIATIMPTAPQILIKQFTGYLIRCMAEFDNKLFIGLENVAVPATSKIVVWDGLIFEDDITGIAPPLAFGRWRDTLVVGFSAATAAIKYRTVGDAPGSWTAVALAGFGCSFAQNCMVEDHENLYIVDGVSKIFKFNGTVLTLERTIGACSSLHALCMQDDILHYGWNKTVNFHAMIGRRDRDSSSLEYVDGYKNLTTDIAAFKNMTAMESYRGQIVCGAYGAVIIATKSNDVQGTAITISAPGASGSAFPILQILRVPNLRV